MCFSTPHPEDPDPEKREEEGDEGSLSMNPKWKDLYNVLKGGPSALRPQDDPSLHEKAPREGSIK